MSMTVLALTLSAALAAPADDKKADDATKAEMKKMEGTWTIEKVVRPGESPPAEELKQLKLEIKGDTRVVKRGDEVIVKSTFKIDPKASPKAIDLTVTEGPDEIKGKTMYGIYELDGDTFKVCLALEGKDRPNKMEGGEGAVLQEFKRVKDDKKK
jgi:uncharacterized protein (TIGR03067 family)